MVLLTLCSGAVMALGLGDIRVLSRPGQPLEAEIPVISNEAGELEDARVTLASPATFARVGLEQPTGLVGDLQFQFAQDARGHAVIRVTSQAPVEQKAISFLIEVNWGSGRLVREYSALVDAPAAATAIAEPVIEAPQAVRRDGQVRRPDVAAAVPAAATRVASRPVAEAVAPGQNLAPVQRGQTLSHIALALARGSDHSLDQMMVALLRANPDAFIAGNINRLKQGAVLRRPPSDELAQIGAAQARAIVREQVAQWRQVRTPQPQPVVSGGTPSSGVAALPVRGARLEIVPALTGNAGKPGTTTGTGGEGDNLVNEQLQQAREDIASRDAEIHELRARVAALETLKQQQARLIALKDSDLAAAQQRLGSSQPADATSTLSVWLWGGVVLVLVGTAAWLLSRRRKPSPFGDGLREYVREPSVAASVPAGTAPLLSQPQPETGQYEVAHELEREQAWRPADEPAQPLVDGGAAAVMVQTAASDQGAQAVAEEPSWHASESHATIRDRLELATAYLDLGERDNARSLLLELAASDDPQTRAQANMLLDRIG